MMNTDLTPIDERDDEEFEAIPEQAEQTGLVSTLEGKPVRIVAEGLSKTFAYQGGLVKAVDGVDFAFTEGQFITIVGPSGSGKSTLLYLLGGLDRPTSGTLHVDGVEVGDLPEWQEHQFRRGKLGFVFQSYHLLPGLTALENVMVPMRLAGGQSWEQMRARASELLVAVGISADRQHHKPGKLSGGQQQRVAIARALANDPKVILADEPTGNLDALNSRRIIELLKDLAEQGKTVIVVTHDRTIAKSAGVCLELSDGRLKGAAKPLAPTRALAPVHKRKGEKEMAEVKTTNTQTQSEPLAEQPEQQRPTVWQRVALGGILLITVFMDFFQLGKNGFGSYYPAAVRSMMDNWHNFFFAAYDPGGFVSIDKPPLGFWLQVISAKIFGFNAVSILVPQALAGVLSVLILYFLVRRHFGVVTGLLAALVLALSPISIVTNRDITIDSTLALTLLVGAWAVLRAAETGRLRWLLLSAVMVGLGFNIKMLEAYLVVPAYAVLYLVAAPRSVWKRVGHLALAGLLLLLVSFSWIVAVDLTPASQRPYVGSTQDNSELSLALGYNGISRLFGAGGTTNGSSTSGGTVTGSTQSTNGGTATGPIQSTNGGVATGSAQSTNGGAPTSVFDIGSVGPLRLFQEALGSQIGWLLPLALLGLLALAWQQRPNVREDRKQQALVFWGMWFLTMGIFFSVAGFFHQYYLTEMAPALAALCGIGLVTMWQDYRRGNWRGWLLPVALVATVLEQVYLLSAYRAWGSWMIPLLVIPSLVAIVILVGVRLVPRLRVKVPNARLLSLALGVAVGILLFAPLVWSLTPILLSSQPDTLLAGPPPAGAGTGGGFIIRSGSQTFTGTVSSKPGGGGPNQTASAALIRYLEANQGHTTFLVAVSNTNAADSLILATNKPVMALGGFANDPILTTSQLVTLIKQDSVRFFLLPTMGQLPQQILTQIPEQYRSQLGSSSAGSTVITTWVTQHCQVVPAHLWQAAATSSTPGSGNQLYDCATIH